MLFFKSINSSIDDLDKLEEKEMTKKRPFSNSIWYDWLISYIPEPMKKRWMVLKTKL